jgi:PKHD-type hydroxylase
MEDQESIIEIAARQSMHPYVVLPGLFSVLECTKIMNDLSDFVRSPGVTWDGEKFTENPIDRKVSNVYLPRSESVTNWVFDRFDVAFKKLALFWGVDIESTEEDLKYFVYSEGCHFSRWHQDTGAAYEARRKISMTVELVDSDRYEGSDLQIFPVEEGHVAGADRKAGTAIAFLSHSYHRVTPLLKGERHVLVNWVSGPPLR